MTTRAAIRPGDLPQDALLRRYCDLGYTDCYVTELDRAVTHAEYVEAFYTTFVFRLERWILRLALSRPSTDDDVRRLAREDAGAFSAWSVEARARDQLLLCDHVGRTRSWLMTEPIDAARTRLYFGSAVVAEHDPSTNERRLRRTYEALLGFHKLYSRVLLRAARARLEKQR